MLLATTELSIPEVARLSGFRSTRRFNDAIRRGFGRPPTALRRSGVDGSCTLSVRLGYRPPLDYAGLLRYLAPRQIPGVADIVGDVWRHAVRSEGVAGIISVRPSADDRALRLEVPVALAHALPALVVRVRRAFDLDADPQAVAARLAPLDPPAGIRLPGSFDPFAVAVRTILGQQVSVAAARTLAGRLMARFGQTGPDLVPFVAPEVLADAPLEGIGLPSARAAAIRALADHVRRGALTFSSGRTLQALQRELLALPGVGPWTAAMLAMRAFGEPDAFPATDLVLRRRFSSEAMVEAYRPWRGYAAMVAWRRASPEEE